MSLELKLISKSYQQGESRLEILKNLSLEVPEGKVIAIVGQSGSGKSTLLSLISGLDDPQQGEIKIHQQNVTHFTQDQWALFRAKNLGIVFQQYHLIPHLTALENVTLSAEISGKNRQQSQQIALHLLDEMGLSQRAHHLPSQLSGGECQRVAIARALAPTPHLILADEPSGNLDPQTGEKVMTYFLEAVKRHQTSTILVTHNQELAKKCDQIFILQNGTLHPL